MKKAKSLVFFLCLLYTASVFSQGQNCNTATPFCDAPGGAGVVFPNNTNNSSQAGPNYGCLTTHPNPAWFYFKTTVAGNYQFNLSQGTTCGAGNIDVDFICWGPFTSPSNCNNLTGTNDVDCSYSPSPTEVIDVNGAPAGQYYIILVTNFANTSGCITLALSATSPPTDCSITCPTVLSGPGIVNYPSTNPLNNVPATPMPSTVACNSGTLAMYATNLTPFGNPIVPGVKIEFTNNSNASNSVQWFENGTNLGGFGSCGGCQPLTLNYDEILQFSYCSPSATTQFSFCETNNTSASASISTTIQDLTNNANFAGSPFSWLNNGACQTITIPPGTIKGISSWTSTCGSCIAATTDWGAAVFNPANAGVGTHTITYSFNSQAAGCSTYTTSIVITVTNPYNAAFVTPGPFCANASCATLTPSNTYTLGTGNWSGTGVSGNTFCPATSGVGTFPVTYTIGTSPTCSASQTNTITVNAIPTANAGPTGSLTCTNSSTILTGSGGSTYTWSGPGIVSGGATSTPTVNQAGTYTVLVANGTCTNSATVSVSQNTTVPVTTASSTGSITCATNTINLTSTLAGANYTWTAPGGSSITSGTNSQNAVGQGSGTYTLTIQSPANGCTTTAVTSASQNTTVPVTTASSSGSITCATNTINLTSTLAGANYTWTAPGGSSITSGTNSQNAVGQGTGTYTLTVQNAINGCTNTAVTSANQNTTAPVTSATSTGSITCTTNTINLTSTLAGANYTWTAPGGSSITSGTNSQNAVGQGSGTYTLTVQSAVNGCTNTAITSANQNTTAPVTSASSTGSITCTTNTINLTSTLAGLSYTWTAPGGSSVTSGTNSQNAVGQGLGTYTLSVTNPVNGCTNTVVTTANQNTATPVANAGSNQTLLCGVPSVTLTGSATPAGANATWLGGVCGSSTSFTTTACAPGTYTLVATNPVTGCTNTSTVSVGSSTNVPQATVNAITNSITCTNTVVAIGVTLTNPDPVSYSWAGPGISGTNNTATTSATLAGTYSVTITNTVSNCQSVFNVIVPTNTTAVTASVSPSASLTCLTTTNTLAATPTGTNYAYNWSGPGTILNGTTQNPTVNTGGNYVVTITNSINGCTGNYTVTVPTNTTAPSLSLTANSLTTTCSSSTVTLNASSNSDPSSTYSWTVPSGGSLTSTTSANPIADGGGVYNVVVTNTINGCVSTVQSVTITADANIPTFTLTTSSASLNCLTTSETVTVNTSSSNLTYSWSPSPSAGGNTSTPTFNTPGVYVCTITNTVNSCSTGAAQVTVTSNTTVPTMTITPGLSLTCISNSVTLTSTTTPTSGVSFTWTGSGIIGATNGSSIDVNVAGNYDVVILDAANGCTNTVSSTVGSNTIAPTLTITPTSTVLSCAFTTSTLNATGSVTNTPTWSTPGGPATNPLTVGVSGDYVATITDPTNGCSTSQTLTITGSTIVPTADAGANTAIPCGNLSTVLAGTTTSTDVVTYEWSGPNATSITSGSNTASPTIIDSGVYTLTVTNTANGCSSTATVNVIQSTVTASFTANPTTGTSPLPVNFTDASVGATSYNWSFGDGNSSTTQNPNNTFNNSGSYTVTLIASNGPCSDTATSVITVEDGLTLEIPNVFTPNGDNTNDVFTIKSTGVKEITLQIFNRWGQKLYEFTGPKASWDGLTPSGTKAPEGTYFYFVIATGFDNKEIKQNGTVNLFR